MNALLLALALAVGDPDAEALEKFKNDYKAKDIAARAAAVEELSKTASPKVTLRLGALLGADGPEVRVAAAKGLALQHDDKKHAIPFLINGAAANAKDNLVLTAIVTSLGSFREEVAAGEVNRLVHSPNLDVARAAVEAAGKIQSATSFDVLIKEMKDCDDVLKPRDQGGAPSFGNDVTRMGTDDARGAVRERASKLKPDIVKALREMSRVTCQDTKDWEVWWAENRGKWKPAKS